MKLPKFKLSAFIKIISFILPLYFLLSFFLKNYKPFLFPLKPSDPVQEFESKIKNMQDIIDQQQLYARRKLNSFKLIPFCKTYINDQLLRMDISELVFSSRDYKLKFEKTILCDFQNDISCESLNTLIKINDSKFFIQNLINNDLLSKNIVKENLDQIYFQAFNKNSYALCFKTKSRIFRYYISSDIYEINNNILKINPKGSWYCENEY